MFSDIDKMVELQSIVIFGIASLFLYLVVPVALFANEVRLAKRSDDTSGTAAIFNSLVQAFYFIVAWSVFVSIIFFLVIKVNTYYHHKKSVNAKERSPSVAIARYWNGPWIVAQGKTSTPGSDIIKTKFPSKSDSIQQAKLLILIITWAKALEMVLLGVLLALTLKLSMSLPLLKMRRADHYKMTTGIDIGTMMSIFMTGILGWVVFIGILNFEGMLVNFLVERGLKDVGISAPFNGEKIDFLKGLKDLLKSGMNRLSQ